MKWGCNEKNEKMIVGGEMLWRDVSQYLRFEGHKGTSRPQWRVWNRECMEHNW